MTPVANSRDSGMLSFDREVGDSGMEGGNIHQWEDLILAQFLSQDDHERRYLGRIGMGARCCVKPRIISGEALTLKHCGVDTNGSLKWDPPPPEEEFFIPGRGDRNFINPFLLRAELSPDIVANLECTKSTESGMRNFFQITTTQNQEEKSDPHEPKALFLGTPAKQDSSGQAAIRNLSELE